MANAAVHSKGVCITYKKNIVFFNYFFYSSYHTKLGLHSKLAGVLIPHGTFSSTQACLQYGERPLKTSDTRSCQALMQHHPSVQLEISKTLEIVVPPDPGFTASINHLSPSFFCL